MSARHGISYRSDLFKGGGHFNMWWNSDVQECNQEVETKVVSTRAGLGK